MIDLSTLVAQARECLSADAYAYISRGAEPGDTVAENERAWRRLGLRPRVLHDVSQISAAVSVLGEELVAPILVAPTAMNQLCDPDGECATARGAAAAGTVMVVSMAATRSYEEVAAAAPDACLWAQMYMLRDRGRTRALAERARDAGYRAIVATVDGASVPYGRNRLGDVAPPPAGLRFPNLTTDHAPDLMRLVNDFDLALTFADLHLFSEWSGLPVVVKGVLRGDDARACVDAGAAAIAVSNHGGRIVDGCIATADALIDVVAAVEGNAEVYVDGGIRSGTDVLRALALGARAVMLGRPVLYGLATGGAAGVTAVLRAFADDLVRAMAFCGACNLRDLDPDLLVRR